MSILTIYNDNPQLSAEYADLLISLKPSVDAYVSSKAEAQKQRMLIIGQVSDYKREHNQRSDEHKLLNRAMEDEGWNKDVVYDNAVAYGEYQYLANNVNESIREFAANAPVTLLKMCGQERRKENGDSSLSAAAYDHWKKTGAYPTQKQSRGFLGGYTNKSFVFKGGGSRSNQSEFRVETKLDPIIDVEAATTNKSPERSTIERPNEMVSAHVEDTESTPTHEPTPTMSVATATQVSDLAAEFDTLYHCLEEIVLKNYQAIKADAEAMKFATYTKQLLASYLKI